MARKTKTGGFFYGNPIYEDEKISKRFCFVWGVAIRDAKVVPMGKTIKTQFILKWQSRTYLRCEVWKGTPFFDMTGQIKKGDLVIAYGHYYEQNYTTRNGIHKTKYNLRVDFLLPAFAVTQMRTYADALRELSEEPDPFFGAHDLMNRITEGHEVKEKDIPFEGVKRNERSKKRCITTHRTVEGHTKTV